MKDLTGQKFGHLTVLSYYGKWASGGSVWKCRCDCGNEVLRLASNLVRTNGSCGCVTSVKDITGQRFGRLVALERVGVTSDGKVTWRCLCDCGNEAIIPGKSLRLGLTKSCGCYRDEVVKEIRATHKQRYTRLYGIWLGVKQRCTNVKSDCFDRYGGRGITVCDEWMTFEPFYEWAMSNGYSDSLTIERIDNNDGYKPSNCTWADNITQARNKRNNLVFTYRGKTANLSALCEQFEKPYKFVLYRIEHGWTIDEAMDLPKGTRVKQYRKNVCT